MFNLGGLKDQMRGAFDTQLRFWAGVAFTALALAAIEYEEVIAPNVSRVSDACGAVATDFSRKLASFTL